MVKGGLTVLISVLMIYGVVYASTVKITPPTGEPTATFYSLSEIANFITANTPATESSPALDWSIALEDTASTTAEIYNALVTKIALLNPTKILTGETYFGVAGTMANNGAQAITPGTSNTAITAGYHNGSGYCAGDAYLVGNNIKSGISIFGVSGNSNVVDTSLGDAAIGDLAINKIAFVDGSQITGTFDPWSPQRLQTIDDWLNGGGTTGTYNEYTGEEATWSAVSGSPFNAGFATSSTPLNYFPVGANVYLFSGRVKQDTRTGLWWSDVASTGAVTAVATSTTNVFTLQGVAGKGDGNRPWDTSTTTVTNGNAINFCNALNDISFGGYTDWYLPTQKQLMQAYIDGSANNLPNPDGSFWSSTENYIDTAYAWSVTLRNGYTYGSTKVFSSYVRCVRP